MTEYFTKNGEEFEKVSDTLFTQEEIDTKILPKRLERERNKFADYDTLKDKASKLDTINSEWEGKLKTVSDEKSELEGKLKTATLEVDKVKIIHELGLSEDHAEFVTGDTAEEMRKRAEKLAKGFKGGKVTIDKKPKDKGDDDPTGSKKLAGNLFGRKKSDD